MHSLDAHNVSINLLFGLDPAERGGKLGGATSIPAPQGDSLPPPPVIGQVTPPASHRLTDSPPRARAHYTPASSLPCPTHCTGSLMHRALLSPLIDRCVAIAASPSLLVLQVTPLRRPAALAELAKSVEAIVARAVGPARTASALTSAASPPAAGADAGTDAAARVDAGPGALGAPMHRWHGLSGAQEVVRELLGRCLAPPKPGAVKRLKGSGGGAGKAELATEVEAVAEGKATRLPSVDEFVRSYFDPRRFEGLPMR